MKNMTINFAWIATRINESSRGGCAKDATSNTEMKLLQKSVWIAIQIKQSAREDCAKAVTRTKAVTE